VSNVEIQIQHGDGRIERRSLNDGTYDLGRDGGDIKLEDPNVSARHARLIVASGSISLVDLGSTNGTFDRQGQRLTAPHALRPRDAVRLGASWIELLSTTAAPGGTRVMSAFPEPAPAAIVPAAPAAIVPAAPPATPLASTPKPVQWRPSFKTYEGCTVHYCSGKVSGESKGRETHVYGGGGGGYVHNGSGYVGSTSISSSTTVHDTLFLLDTNGKEHSFQLSNFDLAVRPEHEVTVVWLIRPGESSGYYLAVRNHTTGRSFFNDNGISWTLFPKANSTFWQTVFAFSVLFTCMLSLIPLLLHRYVLMPAGIQEFKNKLSFVKE
jgi:hypothetical protein